MNYILVEFNVLYQVYYLCTIGLYYKIYDVIFTPSYRGK